MFPLFLFLNKLFMKISEKIPSSLERIPSFISTIIERIRPLGIPEEEIFNIRLSLEEALVNAVKYGNKLDPQLTVEVKVQLDSDKLVIEVKDQGEGFDFEKLEDPTKEENIEKVRGRGIFLMKNLMDEVIFKEKGSRVIMIKFLRREA
ncbi:MAG: ATP-binding protein [Candidatus Omnitrophota bacterium]|nr:MAG: ATP-binding protein [Candidatus Omnitrophota bacterium]RKY34645.1 MAG: ATP-binding protein [Candidatus Omnitrophota bacterium]RKY43527.1 MAG: ATP-binding protein [Candidatus Omnitrophota bacterium]